MKRGIWEAEFIAEFTCEEFVSDCWSVEHRGHGGASCSSIHNDPGLAFAGEPLGAELEAVAIGARGQMNVVVFQSIRIWLSLKHPLFVYIFLYSIIYS